MKTRSIFPWPISWTLAARGLVLAAGLVILATALRAWHVCRNAGQRGVGPVDKTSSAEPIRFETFAALASGYRLREHRCMTCHEEITASYARSGMSRSWRSLVPDLARVWAGSSADVAAPDGNRYGVSFEGGQFWHSERHPDYPGGTIARPAAYLIGSGNHAVAMAWAAGGYLFQMPLAWFASEGSWRMSPGYERKNHRFGRPITAGCVACHTGLNDPSRTKSAPGNWHGPTVAAGIDCDACHGATDRHVKAWQSTDPQLLSSEAAVLNPGRLLPEEANSVCLRCHLQGDVTVYRPGCGPFDLVPGQRLQDWRHDLMIADPEGPRSVASHGTDMLASRCFIASGGRLTCIHCHDPHRPVREVARSRYDACCTQCHVPQACRRSPDPQSVTSCTQCHMPRRPAREGVHLVLTDHRIPRYSERSGSVPRRRDASVADALLPLRSAWPGVELDPTTLGTGYVLWHETMGPRPTALQRGVEYLQRALQTNPDDLESRFWLGSALVALGQGQAARPHLEAALVHPPRRPMARFRLALACELAEELGQAVTIYEQLMMDYPEWLEPYDRLAALHLFLGDPRRAAEVLEKRLARLPDAAAWAWLALAQRRMGAPHDQAMATLHRAFALDPRQPHPYRVRALLWLLAGQPGPAREDLLRAMTLAPDDPELRRALKAVSGLQP